ncbi:reverse transcriptase domain-containing protein [Tanacetum coccineum]
MHSGAANDNRTKTQRGANNVSLRSQGSSKRDPPDGKGLTTSTSLFRQSCLTKPINQLQLNGKTGFSIGARHEEAEFELEAFDITYRPRTSIRGQILVDFITERPDEEGPSIEVQIEQVILEPWTLFMDGSSCLEGSGAGLILTSLEGEEFTYALRFEFDASNNEAEYKALVAGLRISEQISVKNLIAKVDSRLVANQINGLYEAKEQSMTQYLQKAKALIDRFKIFSIEQVSRRIDISGPFPKGQGKVKFLIVAIDYFTKWIEAKPMATITGNQVKKFIWDNIMCRFGLPGKIISGNGKQFRDNPFKDWFEKLNIKQRFASVKHSETNGQVERANRSLGEGIKARLGKDNRNWVEEVPHVLWAHYTIIKTSNGDTPFSLTYGTEAVIPVEIGMPSIRCAEVKHAENDEELLLNLESHPLEKKRNKGQGLGGQTTKQSQREKYYNVKSPQPKAFVRRFCVR